MYQIIMIILRLLYDVIRHLKVKFLAKYPLTKNCHPNIYIYIYICVCVCVCVCVLRIFVRLIFSLNVIFEIKKYLTPLV